MVTKIFKGDAEDLIKEDEAVDKELEALQSPPKAPETEEPPKKEEKPAGETQGADTATPPSDISQPVETTAKQATPPVAPIASTETVSKTEYDALMSKFETLQAEVTRLSAILEDENRETWKAKYATLQGKVYAEVPRTQEENKQLQEKITVLEKENQELRAKDSIAEAEKAKSTQKSNTDAVIEKVRDAHGDEFADMMKEFAEAFISPLQQRAEQLEEQLKEAKKVVAEPPKVETPKSDVSVATKFWTDVTMKVPDWIDINGDKVSGIPGDPRFFKFLNVINPGTGRTYRDDAMTYQQSGDVDGFCSVFTAFKASLLAADTGKLPVKGDKSLKGVDEHIDPATVGGDKTPTETIKTYTRAQVDKFFNDLQKRPQSLNMTQAEIIATQKEYDQAELEGRVIG